VGKIGRYFGGGEVFQTAACTRGGRKRDIDMRGRGLTWGSQALITDPHRQ